MKYIYNVTNIVSLGLFLFFFFHTDVIAIYINQLQIKEPPPFEIIAHSYPTVLVVKILFINSFFFLTTQL